MLALVYFHWLRYHHVVQDVRSDDLQPGNCRRYMMDSRYLFTSLSTLPEERDPGEDRLSRTGEVQAFMTGDGSLVVAVVTVDYHHAGTFGYLYAEDRNDRDSNDRDRAAIDRAAMDHADSCLRVLDNSTRTKLTRHWESFRSD